VVRTEIVEGVLKTIDKLDEIRVHLLLSCTVGLEKMLAGRANVPPERVLDLLRVLAPTRRHGHIALALFGLMGPCDTANNMIENISSQTMLVP